MSKLSSARDGGLQMTTFIGENFDEEKENLRSCLKAWILDIENKWRLRWEFYVTFMLILTLILTPWNIAFGETGDSI
jgi:hypothetical protein